MGPSRSLINTDQTRISYRLGQLFGWGLFDLHLILQRYERVDPRKKHRLTRQGKRERDGTSK
jgi:hypothetical protein